MNGPGTSSATNASRFARRVTCDAAVPEDVCAKRDPDIFLPSDVLENRRLHNRLGAFDLGIVGILGILVIPGHRLGTIGILGKRLGIPNNGLGILGILELKMLVKRSNYTRSV